MKDRPRSGGPIPGGHGQGSRGRGGPGQKSGFGQKSAHPPSKPHGPKPHAAKPHAAKPYGAKPHPGKGQRPPDGPAFRRPSAEVAVLYGFHAVLEALRNKSRKLLDLYATEAAAERLAEDAAKAGVSLHIVAAEDLQRRLGGDSVHQGVMLEARPLEAPDLDGIAANSGVVLVLDQITDPHNVGAILRSAAAFSVDAVVTTERHAPELSGVLAKAASGALEHVAVIEVVNLARALEELGDLGYQRIGLDSEGSEPLQNLDIGHPVALVLGAEGKGLRRLTREKCDVLARLDLPGAIKSLNVSNACAVALTLVQIAAGSK
ncbi:MAG TPA: 23S rRNA (guanosine(2251)-2'-O)-methyltransferase RlmB [Methylovirgula sp.]|nr:23S rRNA (guanosine(2251)-2'-O)-methyltransferase RlmB [Methylovirgula sp.]